jgi:hypothetical protein
MAKKETVEIESNLVETEVYTILFEGNEVEVSGNVANILIKKGKATLK